MNDEDQKPVAWDNLNCATGRSCEYGPHGPNGEQQCQYCGHSAPPDSGAGKSADATDMVDAVVYGVGISLGGRHVSLDQYYEPPTKSVPPDHGGADAETVRVDRSKLNEWADDFEAAAYEVPRGLKATILMTRAQEVRSALSEPAPVAANASAEARLREALKEARLYIWLDSNVPKSKQTMLAFLDEALSAHPHRGEE